MKKKLNQNNSFLLLHFSKKKKKMREKDNNIIKAGTKRKQNKKENRKNETNPRKRIEQITIAKQKPSSAPIWLELMRAWLAQTQARTDTHIHTRPKVVFVLRATSSGRNCVDLTRFNFPVLFWSKIVLRWCPFNCILFFNYLHLISHFSVLRCFHFRCVLFCIFFLFFFFVFSSGIIESL